MKALKQVLGGNLQQYTMMLALVLLVIVFNVASGGRMLTPSNFQNLIAGNAYVLVLAIGMVMVIVVGHIDLSVGSVAAFVGMSVAISIRDFGVPWWGGLLLGLLIGAIVGAWHGFWLSKMGIPGFITTLAGMMIFRGLVIWWSGSISVPVPREFSFFGAGYLPEWGPAATNMNNSTLLLGIVGIAWFIWSELSKRSAAVARGVESPMWASVTRIVLVTAVIGYVTYLFGSGRPGTSFPIPGVILLILVIIYHVITQRTRFGRHIYAVGGNKAAAALSGVNVSKTYFLVMLNMSFLAAVAGILFIGRSTSAGPNDGNMWELDAIAAVFIGGAAVSGGIGTVLGSMIGGLVMAVLNSGLMLMNVGADKTQVIKGLVLLAAVAFDVANKAQGKPSIIGAITARFGGSKTSEKKVESSS
ncbi:sugar ABC transporter permease [Tessaracoccus caeni]|uniref:sugar ABC transporter permease n=1 Tax=Tessaracoccus caeni TaxID=3031239 RepID=UPI0023DBFE8E|nr:sugar ABC transporter permease [Tessaracoccus caeni]MDF1487554.1 sugar ABC transporter permease [Tessaracoccus caeni]